MFKLDNNFLIELGLGALPADEKNKMLAHIYETLEMRVGMKLAEQMSDAQLDEFEGFINRNDEAGALNWLETNFPNYKQVVAEELEKLKGEIKAVAPQIVAESMNNANASSAAPQSQPVVPQSAAANPVMQPQQPLQPTAVPNQPYMAQQMPQSPAQQPVYQQSQQPMPGANPMQQPYQPPQQQAPPQQYPQPPVPPQYPPAQ